MCSDENYKVQQGYECLSACLSNCLYRNGIEVTGSDIFWIGDGFHIVYKQKEVEIGTDIYLSNFNFLEKTGIDFKHAFCGDNQKDFIEQSVQKKGFCIKVGSSYLDYNRVFAQSDNTSHFVNVLDIRDDEILICDGYVPTKIPSTYIGWMKKDKLLEAWKSMDYEYVLLLDIKANTVNDLKKKIKVKMKEGVKGYLDGGNCRGEYYGKDAILQFNNDVREMFLESNMKEQVIGLNFQLKIYGFISSKVMLLESMKAYLGETTFKNGYSDIIECWNKYCVLLVKAGFMQKNNAYESVFRKCQEFVDKECKLLREIIKA